jgi:hypothetical protein
MRDTSVSATTPPAYGLNASDDGLRVPPPIAYREIVRESRRSWDVLDLTMTAAPQQSRPTADQSRRSNACSDAVVQHGAHSRMWGSGPYGAHVVHDERPSALHPTLPACRSGRNTPAKNADSATSEKNAFTRCSGLAASGPSPTRSGRGSMTTCWRTCTRAALLMDRRPQAGRKRRYLARLVVMSILSTNPANVSHSTVGRERAKALTPRAAGQPGSPRTASSRSV